MSDGAAPQEDWFSSSVKTGNQRYFKYSIYWKLQYPANVSDLRSFLGLCSVYRRFVSNFAKLPSPLNKKLRKGEPLQFESDDKERKSVDMSKDKLVTLAMIKLPSFNGICMID